MSAQLELIATHPHEKLWPYWRERLQEWPGEVWRWRHSRGTTGWSMATQGYGFAQFLFRDGQISKQELRRWWRFDRRIRRIGQIRRMRVV